MICSPDEFSESGGIVVPRSLGVAVRLQDWVGGNDLVLQGDLLLALLAAPGGDHGQVGDHLLCVLRLAGAGLASDEHGIVLIIERVRHDKSRFYLLVGQHVPVGSLGDSPEMRRHLQTDNNSPRLLIQALFVKCNVKFFNLVPALAQVNLANPVGVQGVPLVRVDHHNKET